jgi:hypothetical protein
MNSFIGISKSPLSTVDLPIDLPSATATPQKKSGKPTISWQWARRWSSGAISCTRWMPRPTPARCGLSFCAPIALHGGCVALAVVHLAPGEMDYSLGAPVIEIGLTSPRLQATDLPPGPDEVIQKGPLSVAPVQGTGQSARRIRPTW